MQTITLKGNERESVGKISTKVLRNADLVPCVVYGNKGSAPIHFSVNTIDLKPIVFTPNVYTINIELGKKKISATMKDIQFHKVTDDILHVDFFELSDDKPIVMEIPVRIIGNSVGVMKGGALRTNIRKLKVKSLPKNLPDYIEADISNLDIGNKLMVSELKNTKYQILDPENIVVVQVRMSRTASKIAEANATTKK